MGLRQEEAKKESSAAEDQSKRRKKVNKSSAKSVHSFKMARNENSRKTPLARDSEFPNRVCVSADFGYFVTTATMEIAAAH
jgi:hypothetical protein